MPRRTTVNIRLGVVDELFVAHAALRFEPRGPLGLRHVGDDAVLLAGLELVAVVVAGVGERRERGDAHLLFRGLGHGVELAGIVAVVDDLARHDQLVLVVNRDLHVIARHHPAVLRQQPGIRIGLRQLRLPTGLKLREVGLHSRALGHQRRNLLGDILAALLAGRSARSTLLRLRGIALGNRRTVFFDVPVDRRQLCGQPFLRLDAAPAGIAMEKRPVNRHHFAGHQIELAHHQHEFPVHRLERRPVVFAERRDGPKTGLQFPQQPDQLDIAADLARQGAGGADPEQVAVNEKLQ